MKVFEISIVAFALACVADITPGTFGWTCCNRDPTRVQGTGYLPRGTVTEYDGIRIYEVGSDTSSAIIVGIHDISGIDASVPNMKQLADLLADGGFKVILPDFFDGHPWIHRTKPPPPVNAKFTAIPNHTYTLWRERMSWENNTREKVRRILDHVQAERCPQIGMLGWSYGGHQVGLASTEFSQDLKVAIRFTPAPIHLEESVTLGIPTMIVGWEVRETDYADYCQRIEARLGHATCVYEQFLRENAGFMGSEGDWDNPFVKEDAERAIDFTKSFLCKHLPPVKGGAPNVFSNLVMILLSTTTLNGYLVLVIY